MNDQAFMSAAGQPVTISGAELAELTAGLQGGAVFPGDAEYDTSRQLWNGMIDRRPGMIARVTGASDVLDCVRFAAEHDLLIGVRGGGHNVAGNALCDGGLVLDQSDLRGVHVNPGTLRVRVQPGARLADLDRETQAHGLVVPAGIVGKTGVAGLTLGGGFGWLTRSQGFTSDQLVSVDVVTPDGTFLTASADENAELFWGLRGGGGNFGVATSFEFRAMPLGPQVVAGMVAYPFAEAPAVAAFYRELTATAPEQLSSMLLVRLAPPAPFLPTELHGKMIVGIATIYAGPVDEGLRAVAPIKAFGSPAADVIAPKPFRVHQTMFDAASPDGLRYYWKSEFLGPLAPTFDAPFLEAAGRMASPDSVCFIFQLGGALGRTTTNDGAASHRNAQYVLNAAAAWRDPSEDARHMGWARGVWDAVQPFSVGGANINFLTGEEGAARVEASYGDENFRRLQALKSQYDPKNQLRANQNIQPITA